MDLGAHAIASILFTVGALFLYTRPQIRLEHSSAAVLFTLVVAFELFPYRGPPVVSDPVHDAAREISPDVTPEVAPGSTPADAEADAESQQAQGHDSEVFEESAPEDLSPRDGGTEESRELVLRGSDFLLGFGNEALVTICLLLIIANGVEISGALRPVGRLLSRMWFFDHRIALLVTLIVGAFLSAFINNTPSWS